MSVFSFTEPSRGASAADTAPAWSDWNGYLNERYTLGLEEEVMLLNPLDWTVAQVSDQVLARLSEPLARHVAPETHAGVVEVVSGVNPDVTRAVAEISSLRRRLADELRPLNLSVAAAGMHPFTVWEDTELSQTARYRVVAGSMRMLARREPTMALHVHVGVPDPEDAVRLLNGLRRHAPLLLALSGNSPFWQGRDGGFSSARTMLFRAFPRTGLPPFFAGYTEWVQTIEPLIASGAIPDASFLWWDLRLQPALGTVEVRIMDAQSTVADVAALVALIQSIARAELEADSSGVEPSAEVLAENCFLAARDGMDAQLIDPATNHLQPVEMLLEDVLEDCRPHARMLGCAEALRGVERLVMATGADRQRRRVERDRRLDHLVAGLADDFLTEPYRHD